MPIDGFAQAPLLQLSKAMDEGRLSACDLTAAYLDRINAYDHTYSAVLTRNPDALLEAQALDKEAAQTGRRGPLHGMPILVKDNIDTTAPMPTTAGALALEGTYASRDATVVYKLRQAGALILGKTNLSEWANFRSTRSSSGWSTLGGQTRNAYDPARSPGGSSSGSGVAVALGFCAAAVGTETDGSIVGPSALNGIVGIKPTLGAVSRRGIIPISHSQDTAGPMARTVADAAVLLAAMSGTDPADPATASAREFSSPDAFACCSLDGARIGVARTYSGYHDRLEATFEKALVALAAAGATLVDNVYIPPIERIRPSERLVMEYEFKVGLEAYLASRDGELGITSLEQLIEFNRLHADKAMPHFAQEILQQSNSRGTLQDYRYREARANALKEAASDGIDRALREHRLDAIVAPTTTPAWLIDWLMGDNRLGGCACPPAVAGYPHITVPMGSVEHLPVGLSFFASAGRDRDIVAYAHAYEQSTQHRVAPALP